MSGSLSSSIIAVVDDPPPGGGGGAGAPVRMRRLDKMTLAFRFANVVTTRTGVSAREEEVPLSTVPNPLPDPDTTSKGVAGVAVLMPGVALGETEARATSPLIAEPARGPLTELDDMVNTQSNDAKKQ